MAAGEDSKHVRLHGKTRQGLAPLGQSIERVSQPIMRRRGFTGAAVATRWAEIVGRPLSDHSRPFRIVFPRGERRGGTLHLTVTGAFAPEVQHLSPQIIERINGYFGYGAVDRLELHHGRVATSAPAAQAHNKGKSAQPPDDVRLTTAIAKIDDHDLRTALTRLASARTAARKGDD